MTGRIRIISGKWRGRKLSVLDHPGLRPTGDRSRETLFNWLGPSIHGQRCLDLFCGSGALGLEAASRGAGEVVLVEQSPELIQHLQDQVASWHDTAGLEFVRADALSWLGRCDRAFDVVFVDPPHGQGLQIVALKSLIDHERLNPSARVFVEAGRSEGWCQSDEDFVATHFECLRARAVGQVQLGLYRASGL